MTPQLLDSLLTAIAADRQVTDPDDKAALERSADVVRHLSIRPEVLLVVGRGADPIAEAVYDIEQSLGSCRGLLADVERQVEGLAAAVREAT